MTELIQRVLLTRPEGENEALAARLTDCVVMIRPMIRIDLYGDTDPVRQTAMNLDRFDHVIFVSKNSARIGMDLLDHYWPQLPSSVNWYAVGPGTADILAHDNIAADFPEVPGSEGLLALPGLQAVTGQQVLIVRGRGGRELMASTLRQRGAEVDYWELYERLPLHYEDWSLLAEDTTIVLTSGESLQQFIDQAGDISALNAVVVSERVAAVAAEAGFRHVLNAGGASDQALYDGIIAVRNMRNE